MKKTDPRRPTAFALDELNVLSADEQPAVNARTPFLIGDPDPFASHILLRHPRDIRGQLFACTQDDATPEYSVSHTGRGTGHSAWTIQMAEDEEVCQVKALCGPRSFSFGGGAPTRQPGKNDLKPRARFL